MWPDTTTDKPVQIAITLLLPRDELTVPLTRHLLHQCLDELRVDDDCAHDIEVALSEACANVVDHSGVGADYEVEVCVRDDSATIRILDTGTGFDAENLGSVERNLSDERGRGVSLMHALVDRVKLESKPEAGTIVHLDKSLTFKPGGPPPLLRRD
jgi:serine/threonine-protein kinase RsbW